MESTNELSKELLEDIFKDISKYLKKLKGKGKVELIIVGGASILLNYNFRASTTDIDCYDSYGLLMNDITSNIGDKYNLPNDWINTDFLNTTSFTPRIIQFSQYYKTYGDVLIIRTIKDEYLIAMKLKAGRKHKHDLSDVLGILKSKPNISINEINKAIIDLYDSIDNVDQNAYKTMLVWLNDVDGAAYDKVTKQERKAKDKLIKSFQNKKIAI